jgi:beta-lactamase regulating signal transducer with metallopeptidase domain
MIGWCNRAHNYMAEQEHLLSWWALGGAVVAAVMQLVWQVRALRAKQALGPHIMNKWIHRFG